MLAEDAAAPAPATTTQTPGEPVKEGAKQPEGGMWSMMLPLVLMLVVFYFILIRPQRKKEQERQKTREEMLKNMKKNDKVMTIGGMVGNVASITDEFVVLKVDEKNDVRIKFNRDAISKVLDKESGAGEGIEKSEPHRSDRRRARPLDRGR
jgi:preprotein translocase subunit YajC